MRIVRCFFAAFLGLSIQLLCWNAHAQYVQNDAQRYILEHKYDSAISLLDPLYKSSPNEYYDDLLQCYLAIKDYKKAESLVVKSQALPGASPTYWVDLGQIYALNNKEAKAVEQYDKALEKVNGDDLITQKLSRAFIQIKRQDYAIKVFEKATELLRNPFIYSAQLATLFAKSGQIDKAIDVILTGNPGQFMTIDHAKEMFLEWMGNDEQKLKLAQKNILKRVNERPDVNYYAELLTWIYTQRGDWEGALLQIIGIDERNNMQGKRLLDFAFTAKGAKQYEYAQKALEEIIVKGKETPLYPDALVQSAVIAFDKVKQAAKPTPEEIQALMQRYKEIMVQYPLYEASPLMGDYAYIAAQLADSVDMGVDLLQKAINNPEIKRNTKGELKLQLGDYYVLQGKIWDASLTYSQVDKDFKQDMLGEEARYRNAKLAYYRADFDWAQRQLKVLKSSTSQLIANDALFLSVTITENVEDTNYYPLKRFAYADLLLFRNKDVLAEALLDSINTAFPKHPLNDDILMLRARLESKHKNYDKAIKLLDEIVQNYGQDVLGDDALYQIAEINYNNLNNKAEAKKYYERVIIDFAGSTYVQMARLRLKEIDKPLVP